MPGKPARPYLVVMKGLPGSGKTTAAKQLTDDNTYRLSRDDMRLMLTGNPAAGVLDGATERAITQATEAMAQQMLATGRNVIVDATNLSSRDADRWDRLAFSAGAEVLVHDLTGVPYHVAAERNAARDHPVPDHVMQAMADRAGIPR